MSGTSFWAITTVVVVVAFAVFFWLEDLYIRHLDKKLDALIGLRKDYHGYNPDRSRHSHADGSIRTPSE
jgi:hypothetical protein